MLLISSAFFQTVCVDDEINVWIGTWGKGLNLLENGSSDFIRFVNDKEDSNAIACNQIVRIYFPNDPVFNVLIKSERRQSLIIYYSIALINPVGAFYPLITPRPHFSNP